MHGNSKIFFVFLLIKLLNLALPVLCIWGGCLTWWMLPYDAYVFFAIDMITLLAFSYMLRWKHLLITVAGIYVWGEVNVHIQEAYNVFLIHDRIPSGISLLIGIPLTFAMAFVSGRILRFLVSKLPIKKRA